jgi:capsid portal protein
VYVYKVRTIGIFYIYGVENLIKICKYLLYNLINWYASGRTENRYAYRKPVDLNSTTYFHTLHSRACDDRKKKIFLRIYIFFPTGFGYWMLFLS